MFFTVKTHSYTVTGKHRYAKGMSYFADDMVSISMAKNLTVPSTLAVANMAPSGDNTTSTISLYRHTYISLATNSTMLDVRYC